MYEIDRGIPLPKPSKYPFKDMGPGDSFFMPGDPAETSKRLSDAAGQFQRNYSALGAQFKTRRVSGEQPGARCWRVR